MKDLKNKGIGTIAIHAGHQLQYIKHQHLYLILQSKEEQDLQEKRKGISIQDLETLQQQ